MFGEWGADCVATRDRGEGVQAGVSCGDEERRVGGQDCEAAEGVMSLGEGSFFSVLDGTSVGRPKTFS